MLINISNHFAFLFFLFFAFCKNGLDNNPLPVFSRWSAENTLSVVAEQSALNILAFSREAPFFDKDVFILSIYSCASLLYFSGVWLISIWLSGFSNNKKTFTFARRCYVGQRHRPNLSYLSLNLFSFLFLTLFSISVLSWGQMVKILAKSSVHLFYFVLLYIGLNISMAVTFTP